MMLIIFVLMSKLHLMQNDTPSIALTEYMKMTNEICSKNRMKDYFHPENGYDGKVLFVQFPPSFKIEGAENREYFLDSDYGRIVFIHKNNRFHHHRMAWFEYCDIEYVDGLFLSVFHNYNDIDSKEPQPKLKFSIRAKFIEGQLSSIRVK